MWCCSLVVRSLWNVGSYSPVKRRWGKWWMELIYLHISTVHSRLSGLWCINNRDMSCLKIMPVYSACLVQMGRPCLAFSLLENSCYQTVLNFNIRYNRNIHCHDNLKYRYSSPSALHRWSSANLNSVPSLDLSPNLLCIPMVNADGQVLGIFYCLFWWVNLFSLCRHVFFNPPNKYSMSFI